MNIHPISLYFCKNNAIPNQAKISLGEASTIATGLAKIVERKNGNFLEAGLIKLTESKNKLFTLLGNKSQIIGQCEFEHGKNNIRIVNLSSVRGDKYKGIGSRLLDEVFSYSIENDFGGRIQLYASNYSDLLPRPYCNTKNITPSPVPFYLKYGFVPQKTSYPNTPNFDFSTLNECEMFLPQESIMRLRKRLGI